ncbi:MAG TPA: cytochrome c biogenesis heme-transporting ATPase CcmA [Steroidobacteraceae bacterium]|nr:cytochrome c biogenesis heme-transporting ATPase CcmA [Steroidobacteraceae bacterium]
MADSPAVPLLEARALHLWRGENHLLRGVSFTVQSGEFLQVTGPNGVGKSTLLRAVCLLLPLEAGELLWRGAPMTSQRDEFAAHLAYLAHANALKADLSAEENLRFEIALRRPIERSEIEHALGVVGIPQCARLPMRVLSAGQRRRLALARVLLCRASLWVLDEPTTNLDADGSALVERLLLQHLESGGAVITAAHVGLLASYRASRSLDLRR